MREVFCISKIGKNIFFFFLRVLIFHPQYPYLSITFSLTNKFSHLNGILHDTLAFIRVQDCADVLLKYHFKFYELKNRKGA